MSNQKNFFIADHATNRSYNGWAALIAERGTNQGEAFNVWYTAGVVRHYDANGQFISAEEQRLPDDYEVIGEKSLSHSMLTDEVLTRFEELVNVDTLTPEEMEHVEHCAYSACIGNLGNAAEEWERFKQILHDVYGFTVPQTAAERVAEITAIVEAGKTRSAWTRGVKAYALDMLEEMAFNAKHGYLDLDAFSNSKMLRDALLNGAGDWSQYSWGGSALIYDPDIAERLCNPSEFKKTRNGERRPNSREEWLDTQARALGQAAWLIVDANRHLPAIA